MIASQLSGRCDVISNRLWRHQQNKTRTSETRERRVKVDVFLSSFMYSLCRVRNKILYVLSWRTVSALIRVLFWYSNYPLISSETVSHSSTYTIFYVFLVIVLKRQSWGPNKICERMLHTVTYIYVRPKVTLTDCCVWIFRHFCSTSISRGNSGLLAVDAWYRGIAQRRTRTSSQRRAIAEAVGMEQHLHPVRGHSSPVGCVYCTGMWTAGRRTMLLLEAI